MMKDQFKSSLHRDMAPVATGLQNAGRWLTVRQRSGISCLLMTVVMLYVSSLARGSSAWLDGWTFRRQVEVNWDPDKAAGDDLATAEFFTAGHAMARGEDIRVSDDDGHIVPSHLLRCGPGDVAEVAFVLQKGARKYYVFFGNPAPVGPSKGSDQVPWRCGLFYEMRAWAGGAADNFNDLQKDWERGKDIVGQTIVHSLFSGVNPFDDRAQGMVRMEGVLFTPIDGNYEFALAANVRGALWIDGKPLVFAHGCPGDVRFKKEVDLKRGKHDIVFLQAFADGDLRMSAAWKRPDSDHFELIDREFFGIARRGVVGPLEELHKTLTADFKVQHLAESFFEKHYAYRYSFTANVGGLAKTVAVKYDWDFDDGQTASGPVAGHVYLTDGDFAVKLTVHLGASSDTQAIRVHATRDMDQITNPPKDEPHVQSAIVAGYDLTKLPVRLLPWATLLHERAGAVGPMLLAGQATAARKAEDAQAAMNAMQQASSKGVADGKIDAVVAMWDAIPVDALYKGRAAGCEASVLLWRAADFEKAVKVIEPYGGKGADSRLRRHYGQALILSGKADAGRRILEELPIDGKAEEAAARSGAMARTVEYYITEGDAEAGEDNWERWQAKYPADFLEGYSVLLQTKLIEMQKLPEAAARVAEAFAIAMPRSSYAPALLDRASKIMAKIDFHKSQTLRDLLKQRYPEDPLSNPK